VTSVGFSRRIPSFPRLAVGLGLLAASGCADAGLADKVFLGADRFLAFIQIIIITLVVSFLLVCAATIKRILAKKEEDEKEQNHD
jgi:hypothetical protein